MKTPLPIPSGTKKSIKILQHIKLQQQQQKQLSDSSFEVLDGSFSELKPINGPRTKQIKYREFQPPVTSTPVHMYEDITDVESSSETESKTNEDFVKNIKNLVLQAQSTIKKKSLKRQRLLRKLEEYSTKKAKIEHRLTKLNQVISVAEQIIEINVE